MRKVPAALLLAVAPLCWLILTVCFISREFLSDSILMVAGAEFALFQKMGFPPDSWNNIFSLDRLNFCYLYCGSFHAAHLWFSPLLILLGRMKLLLGSPTPLFPYLQLLTAVAGFFCLWISALITFHSTKDLRSGALTSLGVGALHAFWFYSMQPKAYIFTVLLLLIAVWLYLKLRPNLLSAVLVGLTCGLSMLMSQTAAGILALFVLLETTQKKKVAASMARCALIVIPALILFFGAYLAREIHAPHSGRSIPNLLRGTWLTLTDTAGIPKVTAARALPFQEKLSFQIQKFSSFNAAHSFKDPARNLFGTSSALLLALLALGLLAIFILTLVGRGSFAGWLFSLGWFLVFTLEFTLGDPWNDFAWLPLIGLVFLPAIASRYSRLYQGFLAFCFLLLLGTNFVHSILPMHEKTNALYPPERERLAGRISPEDMLISDVENENIELVYAFRMMTVNLNTIYETPLDEKKAASDLKKYAANHRIFYVPIDEIYLHGRERRRDEIEAFFKRYFTLKPAFSYPMKGRITRTYYELIPK